MEELIEDLKSKNAFVNNVDHTIPLHDFTFTDVFKLNNAGNMICTKNITWPEGTTLSMPAGFHLNSDNTLNIPVYDLNSVDSAMVDDSNTGAVPAFKKTEKDSEKFTDFSSAFKAGNFSMNIDPRRSSTYSDIHDDDKVLTPDSKRIQSASKKLNASAEKFNTVFRKFMGSRKGTDLPKGSGTYSKGSNFNPGLPTTHFDDSIGYQEPC